MSEMFDHQYRSPEFRSSVANVGMVVLVNTVMSRYIELHETFPEPLAGPYGALVECLVVEQHRQDARTGKSYDDILLMHPSVLQARLERGVSPGETLSARPIRLVSTVYPRIDISRKHHLNVQESGIEPSRFVPGLMRDLIFPEEGNHFAYMISVSIDPTNDDVDVNNTSLEVVYEIESVFPDDNSLFDTIYGVGTQIVQGRAATI